MPDWYVLRRRILNPTQTQGKWFEEYFPGLKLETTGRTITEADVVNFAGVSGDFNPLHLDDVFSRAGIYKQRVAHGLLVVSVASGLLMQTGILGGTVGAFREINQWKFILPVYIGDTIRVILDVQQTKAAPALGGGLVKVALSVQNQENQTVMKGIWSIFVLSKSTQDLS